MPIRDSLDKLLASRSLTRAQATTTFDEILSGRADDAQIAALLALIQSRGATVDELTGAAESMRRHAAHVPVQDSIDAPIIDTCGTGGAPKAFNVSTCAAIVAAAAAPKKIRVAKHGNRSRTGRGSAEVLAALGVNIDASLETQARCLDTVGVCFCFAIHHHPAVKHAMPARRSLGFPTIFNLLGPLTNPANAKRQLIGVYAESLVEPMARALANLGTERAMIVHGLDGLDEISIGAPTRVAHVERNHIRIDTIHPDRVGLRHATLDQLQADSLDRAVELFKDILAGEPGPTRDIVLINAAAALVVGAAAPDLAVGVRICQNAIDEGDATRTLARLVEISHTK